MAVKKRGEPHGRLGNQGYQEGNEGREPAGPEEEKQDLDGPRGKTAHDTEAFGTEAGTVSAKEKASNSHCPLYLRYAG